MNPHNCYYGQTVPTHIIYDDSIYDGRRPGDIF